MVKNLGVSDLSMKVLETEFTDDEAAIPDNLFPSIPPVLEILVLNDCHKCSRLVYVVERSDLVSSDLILTPFIDDGVDHFMMVSVRQRREDFVVDSEEDSENDGGLSSLPAQIRSGMKSTSSSEFMPIVTLINNRLQSSYDGTQVIREFDSALQTILKNCNETQTGVYTLIDLLSSSMPVDQIDVVSKKISILLASIRELPRQSSGARDRSLEIIQTIKIGSLLSQRMAKRPQGVNSEEELHIVQVYEKLLQLYLHILPANTSPAVNVWLENIIRQTTMQLVLSGHGIKLVNTAETSGTKDAEISMADNLQSQEFELPMRLRDENQDVIPSGSQRRRSKGSASISRPSTSTSIICPSSQQASDTESEYTQPLGSALADYIVFRPTSPLPQSMRKGIPEWQIGAQPSGDGWKSISRSVSQESLRIPRQDRKRKRDKGKGRADQTVADEMTPQLSNTKLVTSSQTNNVPSVRLDLDDLLIASQPISSQVLPMASQRLGTELFSSQLMPISSSQPVNHASSSQNKTKRFKKQSTIKKRPSGFR